MNCILSIVLLFLIPKRRQRDVVFHGKQADGADGYEGSNHRYVEAHAKIAEAPVDETADDASHRINLLAENHRLLIQKYITDDTTATQNGKPQSRVFWIPAILKSAKPRVSKRNQVLSRRFR